MKFLPQLNFQGGVKRIIPHGLGCVWVVPGQDPRPLQQHFEFKQGLTSDNMQSSCCASQPLHSSLLSGDLGAPFFP